MAVTRPPRVRCADPATATGLWLAAAMFTAAILLFLL